MDKITSKEADKLDEIEKKLIQEFKQQFKNELRQEQIKRQTFEPITVAIGKVEEKIGDVLNENKNLMGLVPVVNQMGDKITTIDMDDIIVDGEKFVGTPGLWRLLTYREAPEDRLYSDEDLENYSKILWKTNSIYINNDPTSKKPKSSKGHKYINLIKKIWENRVEGSGVKKYSENKIEYRYIDDLNKLDGYLNFIISEEMAGNNNYSNEKKQ